MPISDMISNSLSIPQSPFDVPFQLLHTGFFCRSDVWKCAGSAAVPLGVPVLQQVGQHVAGGRVHGHRQCGGSLLRLPCPPVLCVLAGLDGSAAFDAVPHGFPGFIHSFLHGCCGEPAVLCQLLRYCVGQSVNGDFLSGCHLSHLWHLLQ